MYTLGLKTLSVFNVITCPWSVSPSSWCQCFKTYQKHPESSPLPTSRPDAPVSDIGGNDLGHLLQLPPFASFPQASLASIVLHPVFGLQKGIEQAMASAKPTIEHYHCYPNPPLNRKITTPFQKASIYTWQLSGRNLRGHRGHRGHRIAHRHRAPKQGRGVICSVTSWCSVTTLGGQGERSHIQNGVVPAPDVRQDSGSHLRTHNHFQATYVLPSFRENPAR